MIKIIDNNIINNINNINENNINNNQNITLINDIGYPIIEKDTFYNNAAPSQVNKFNKAMKNLNDFL